METPYILFQTGRQKFLVKMEYVVLIEQAGKVDDGNIPVYNFGQACHITNGGEHVQYTVFFKTGEKEFGVLADLVEDIRMIEDDAVHILKNPVIWKKNDYLAGAVHIEDMEPPVLYVLDVFRLYEKVSEYEPAYWY